jgi:RHS repeat-associated protein
VFNGDTLLATVDQQMASGVATGTAKTRYIHPDHLGSTNVVTDENDNVVQTMDYYPYGATRISVSTSTKEKRQFIGQFTDDSTLSYLNSRYYNGSQGQFLSEDPLFLLTPAQQNLKDPQSLNSYSYSEDNPITKSDPSGKYYQVAVSGTGEGLSGSAAVQFTMFPPVLLRSSWWLRWWFGRFAVFVLLHPRTSSTRLGSDSFLRGRFCTWCRCRR